MNKKHFLILSIVWLALFGCQNREIKTANTTEIKGEKIEKKTNKLSTTIYGWQPYTTLGNLENLNLELLTTVSYYSVEVVRGGFNKITLKKQGFDDVREENFLKKAHNAGCRIDLTFECNNAELVATLLNDKSAAALCIDKIIHMVDTTSLFIDGICIDFQDIPANNSDALVVFMKSLKESLKKSKRTLKLVLPAMDTRNAFDIMILNQLVDQYVLWGIDYHFADKSEGAITPFDAKSSRNHLKGSVVEYLNKGVPYEKLIVTLPIYGIVWQQQGNGTTSKFTKYITYSEIMKHIEEVQPIINLDSTSLTYFYDYRQDGKKYRCYFDDERTLEKKYKWLIKQKVAGIGIYALGYDKGYTTIWEMIEKNFKVEKLLLPKKDTSITLIDSI